MTSAGKKTQTRCQKANRRRLRCAHERQHGGCRVEKINFQFSARWLRKRKRPDATQGQATRNRRENNPVNQFVPNQRPTCAARAGARQPDETFGSTHGSRYSATWRSAQTCAHALCVAMSRLPHYTVKSCVTLLHHFM